MTNFHTLQPMAFFAGTNSAYIMRSVPLPECGICTHHRRAV